MEFKVAVVAGSKSDEKYVKIAEEVLKEKNISYETVFLSAHREPEKTRKFALEAEKKGFNLIIAIAGYSAHLPGFLASFSSLPVIGVPIPSSPLFGLDSLLSMVQMPKGVPVAVMSVGEAGAKNAALFAERVKALFDSG